MGPCGSRLCENSLEPRTRRIVFSIAFSQEKSPVQSVPTTTKLRQKFYAQLQSRSFHTAWTHNGHRDGSPGAVTKITWIARLLAHCNGVIDIHSPPLRSACSARIAQPKSRSKRNSVGSAEGR